MSDEQQTSPTSDLENVEGGTLYGKDKILAEREEETGADPEASRRAVEAFDAIPGDSEYDTEEGVVRERQGGPLMKTVAELKSHEYFELNVEVTVRLPDGTIMEYRESSERNAPDDYNLDEAVIMLDVASETMVRRLTRQGQDF